MAYVKTFATIQLHLVLGIVTLFSFLSLLYRHEEAGPNTMSGKYVNCCYGGENGCILAGANIHRLTWLPIKHHVNIQHEHHDARLGRTESGIHRKKCVQRSGDRVCVLRRCHT